MSDNSSVARAILDVIGQQPSDDEPVSVVFINHIASGQLRAVKLGDATSAWLIPADEAARYIATQRDNEAGAA